MSSIMRILKKILIFCDLLFLILTIIFIVYAFNIPFYDYDKLQIYFGIIFIYEIINIIKINKIKNLNKSILIKIWLILSIVAFIVPALFLLLLWVAFANGG